MTNMKREFNSIGNGWRLYQEISSEYANENKTSTAATTYPLFGGSNDTSYFRAAFQYDGSNMIQRISEIKHQGTWYLSGRYTYEYNNNGNMTLQIYEGIKDGGFVNYQKTSYQYDSNENMTLTLEELWDEIDWKNYKKSTYVYDANENTTLFTVEGWDDLNWVFTFNEKLNLEECLSCYDYSFNGAKIEIFYNALTDIKEEELLTKFSLEQNYPNPFNPSTKIEYSIPLSRGVRGVLKNSLPAFGVVTLKVYDMLGREVATLVNKKQNPGNYKVNFNASQLASGIYFYRLQAGNFVETKKINSNEIEKWKKADRRPAKKMSGGLETGKDKTTYPHFGKKSLSHSVCGGISE